MQDQHITLRITSPVHPPLQTFAVHSLKISTYHTSPHRSSRYRRRPPCSSFSSHNCHMPRYTPYCVAFCVHTQRRCSSSKKHKCKCTNTSLKRISSRRTRLR